MNGAWREITVNPGYIESLMSRVGRFYVIVYNGMELSNVLECLLIDKGFDVSSRDEVNEFNMFYLK